MLPRRHPRFEKSIIFTYRYQLWREKIIINFKQSKNKKKTRIQSQHQVWFGEVHRKRRRACSRARNIPIADDVLANSRSKTWAIVHWRKLARQACWVEAGACSRSVHYVFDEWSRRWWWILTAKGGVFKLKIRRNKLQAQLEERLGTLGGFMEEGVFRMASTS